MDNLLITGWPNIAEALGVKTIKTAKKWVEKYHMPVVVIGSRPTVLVSVFERWWVNVHGIAKKKKKSNQRN